MKIESEKLITDLVERTEKVLERSQQFLILTEEELNHRNSATSWSVLECLEHLNLYGRFYLKEMKKRMLESQESNVVLFKSGVLGNYFAKSMIPSESMKPMKTFQNMNPINSSLDKTVITEFIQQQTDMLQLLQIAKKKNLNRIKCSITISRLIKLKLGDTFRFVIHHNERHLLQAERALRNSTFSNWLEAPLSKVV